MPIIRGDIRPDGKIRVWQTNPGMDSLEGWESVDKIPEYPPYKRGINHIMLYDPIKKEFLFEEEERKLDEAEALEKVAEALEKIAENLCQLYSEKK